MWIYWILLQIADSRSLDYRQTVSDSVHCNATDAFCTALAQNEKTRVSLHHRHDGVWRCFDSSLPSDPKAMQSVARPQDVASVWIMYVCQRIDCVSA